jgi:hypothetical protein
MNSKGESDTEYDSELVSQLKEFTMESLKE